MNHLRTLRQGLSTVSRLWEKEDFDGALVEVERLLASWPGNPHLHVLWASLVQFQEHPAHELHEAKQALQKAIDLDKCSPAASVELGHFLDNVEDDPHAASKVYTEAIVAARKLLIDALIGQAKAYRQMEKWAEFRRCLLEVLHLARFERGPKKTLPDDTGDIIFESPRGHYHAIQLDGRYAAQIQELISEMSANGAP